MVQYFGVYQPTVKLYLNSKKIIRIITNSDNKASCQDLFKNYIVSLFSRNTYFPYLHLLLRI